jgi:hypothetical protein
MHPWVGMGETNVYRILVRKHLGDIDYDDDGGGQN